MCDSYPEMAPPISDRKLYLGPRLRVLRRELGLNQAAMAQELGVSPSYLNHLERNQRPLTAQMLLRLANTYQIDVREFAADASQAAASDLHTVMADPLVRDIGVPRHEVMEVAENYPGVSEAIIRLYRALADLRQMPDRVEQLTVRAAAAPNSVEWLRDHLQARRHHIAELDEAAEKLSAELGSGAERPGRHLSAALATRFGVRVQTVPDGVLVDVLWHYDLHRRRLMLAERLPDTSAQFAVAVRLASFALFDDLEAEVARAAPPDEDTAALVRKYLANYAAAAILMPYGRFRDAAAATRHDLDLLLARFGVSYEQAAHRLVTLGRQGARGVPFFMLKVDSAGLVSKRGSADGVWLARTGGGCGRWGIQRAFRLPGETVAASVESPDGLVYLTFARAHTRHGGRAQQMIVLGCPSKFREQVAIAGETASDPIPIGSTCHLCERSRCSDRALPLITRALDFSSAAQPSSPYPFRAT